jgi:putative transposase
LVGIDGGAVSWVTNLESPALARWAGDHATKNITTTPELSHSTTESNSHLFDDWFDPIEAGIRDRVRGLIEAMIGGELDAALSRPRYGRRAAHAEDSGVAAVVTGHRHGRRVRTLTGTFGKTEIAVPRARLNTSDGKTTEWKSQALRNGTCSALRAIA